MSAKEIHALAHSMMAVTEQFEKATAPLVAEWARLQVMHDKFTEAEADRDFKFEDFTNDETGLIFRSEDWEESWQYGGYEKHYGRSTVIPFEFFDNPQPYQYAADQAVQDRIDFKNRYEAQEKRNRVARLEAQLAKAREQL